jgi:hypothetical protein
VYRFDDDAPAPHGAAALFQVRPRSAAQRRASGIVTSIAGALTSTATSLFMDSWCRSVGTAT